MLDPQPPRRTPVVHHTAGRDTPVSRAISAFGPRHNLRHAAPGRHWPDAVRRYSMKSSMTCGGQLPTLNSPVE